MNVDRDINPHILYTINFDLKRWCEMKMFSVHLLKSEKKVQLQNVILVLYHDNLLFAAIVFVSMEHNSVLMLLG